MADKNEEMRSLLEAAPVVPVVVLEEAETAVPLARALAGGGLHVIEITLRTGAAIEAIRRIAGEVEDAVVGAGTVLGAAQLEAAEKAGARFAVSPGSSPDLLLAARNSPLPFLPGGATASEAMALRERGYTYQKFFPAEPAGGVAYLRALASPLPEIRFCPTGGIGPDNVAGYLGLPNVICVGGSWVAPADAIKAGNWPRITELSRSAARLTRAAAGAKRT